MKRRPQSKIDPEVMEIVRAEITAGLSSYEIAERHELTPRRVRRYAEMIGLAGLKPHQRQFTFRCGTKTARLIRQLANETGESPAKKIDQLLAVALSDGITAARRRLGKLHRIKGASNGKV